MTRDGQKLNARRHAELLLGKLWLAPMKIIDMEDSDQLAWRGSVAGHGGRPSIRHRSVGVVKLRAVHPQPALIPCSSLYVFDNVLVDLKR